MSKDQAPEVRENTVKVRVFNGVMGYGLLAAEAAQNYTNLYSCLPYSTYFRDYLASFLGAYIAPLAMETIPPESMQPNSRALTATFAAAALTGWEIMNVLIDARSNNNYSGAFDWSDMACYAAALGLYFLINREKPATLSQAFAAPEINT